MDFLFIVLFPFLAAASTSFLVTPLVIKYSTKLGIIDDPKKHKHPKVIHTKPTPRGGGIPLFAGILVGSLLFLPLDKHLLGILSGAFFLAVLGLLDDRYDLSPYKRLVFQFLVAGIPIASGIGIAFIGLPILSNLLSDSSFFSGLTNADPSTGIIDLSHPRIVFNFFGERSIWVLSDLFALLWIVLLMNFINMGAKGVDGQLTGTIIVAATTIAALSLRFSADITEWPVTSLAMITAGTYFGFLPWHVFPQKIMPGFGGSTLAGFMLGVLSILSTTKVGTLTVILAVPLIDTGYTVARRIMNGKSPFQGDRTHLHHKLLDAGLSKKQVAVFYWATSALLGIAALHLNASQKVYTILGVAVLFFGILIWLKFKKV